jgi:predicted  nucleic acid-binding Zn-ribbon protein
MIAAVTRDIPERPLEPQIADLIALQKVDSCIREEKAQIAAVPDAVAKLDGQIQEYKDKLDARKNDLEEARKEWRQLEGELQTINDKLSKYQDQLMQVKTNEAYSAMMKEIGNTKEEISQHEDKILVDMVAVDELAAEIEALEKQFEGDHVRLEKEKVEVEEGGRRAEERLRDHEEERKRLAHSLDAPTLASYEKVAAMRGGTGVAQVKEELCLGCRVKVPPQVFEGVRTGRGLRQCDTCGRFLYDVEEFEGAEAKKPPEGEAPAESPPADAAPPAPEEPST